MALCILSGIMLGASFPPSPAGLLACFGLVPLLIILADIDDIGTGLRYSYVAFLVFHIITLNWTGGYAVGKDPYMAIAGTVTMIVHPLFYFIPMFIYMLVKRFHGERAALIALPFAWVGYEYTHSLSEWSFPWLTIGNSQSYDLARMQFISVTGVYGLSFWIIVLNILAYLLYSSLARRKAVSISRASAAWLAAFVVLYYIPAIYGWAVLSGAPPVTNPTAEEKKTVTIGMIQSNIDPWDKWSMRGYDAIDLYLKMTRSLIDSTTRGRPDLVLWPETALPYDLHTDLNRMLLADVRRQVNSLDVAVLTGMPYFEFYTDPSKAPPSAKKLKSSGERYDAYNAAVLLQPGMLDMPWYGKEKMVPIAERVPYADAFYFIDFLRWDVGIGGWQIGPRQTIFQERKTGTQFCTVICYESVYPGFVASFVRKGAEFISIITIDSWWDHMSGAYQHAQFAIFRAVENRRWVARCAVGGISCYIDPYGRVYDKTTLFTKASLNRTIGRREDLTFYTEHGDWLGQVCLCVAGLFFAAAVGVRFKNKIREQQWQSK